MINNNIKLEKNHNTDTYITVIIANLGLAVLKLALGVVGYSKLVLMDGIFSFSNAIILLLMWQGDKLERKVPDEKHPYGYGKILFVLATFSGFVLLIISIYMFFFSVNGMTWNDIHRSHSGAMMAAVISIFANEVLYRYMMDEGKRSSNNILMWNAVNNRINVLISSVVLICVTLSSFGISSAERLGVGLVSFIIFLTSLRVLLKSFAGIMDKVPPKSILDKIKSLANKTEGVNKVVDVKARYIGTLLYADLHINVNDNLSLKDADSIANKVEKILIEKMPIVKEVNAIVS